MSFGEGIRMLPVRQHVVSLLWIRSKALLWAAYTLSLAGYLLFFLTLHLRSVGWAPGQVLEPLPAYWRWFYHIVFDEERVMAARRSALAAHHPLLMIGALAIISAGYLATIYLLRAPDADRRPRLRTLLLLALLFSLPLLSLPNLLSGDIYSYISFGRIATLHGGNPFIDAPGRYPSDRYFHFVDWKQVPSVYGPGWIYPSMVVTLLVESLWSSVITYVLAYKLLALLLHLLNGALVWAILQRWRPEQRGWGTALYVLNPLALIEFAGNGHNDVLMISFILLGILLHLRGLWIGAVAAFTLAILTKWIALPLLPLYGLLLGSRLRLRRRLWYMAGSFGVFAAVSASLYLPYWEGPATLRVLLDAPPQKRLVNSLGQLAVQEVQYGMYRLGKWPHPVFSDFVPLVPGAPQMPIVEDTQRESWRAQQQIRLNRYNQRHLLQQREVLLHQQRLRNIVRVAGLAVVMLACLAGALATRSLETMLLAGAWIFFTYTTIGAVWVWPWYATWFVALAALLDWRVTGRTALLLSLLALLIYPLYPAMPTPAWFERFRAVFIFGPPLVFAGVRGWGLGVRGRRSRLPAPNP